jgi:signal transduction histidine kinase
MDAERDVVLVVDDEDVLRWLARDTLEPRHDVLEAADGLAAVELVRTRRVDLVLLDVRMPRMGGFEACPLLKQAAGDSYLPVLFLTGLDARADRIAGLHAGADDFLRKPLDTDELLLRVGHFLTRRRQEAVIRQQVTHLEELHALKDDLVSMLAHDLRNPLAGILMMLEVMATRYPPDRRDLDSLMRAGLRMREMLDDLLEVRLLEEGRMTLQREPQPLLPILHEAASAVRAGVAARKLTLTVDPTEVVADVDARLLRRALENLLSNAIKYSRSGGAVDIAVEPGDTSVDLLVIDRGAGISEAARERLFQKFGAVDARDAHARHGFGLGLYQVSLVAAAHGGGVHTEDRPGGGTVFRLTLPLAAPA